MFVHRVRLGCCGKADFKSAMRNATEEENEQADFNPPVMS